MCHTVINYMHGDQVGEVDEVCPRASSSQGQVDLMMQTDCSEQWQHSWYTVLIKYMLCSMLNHNLYTKHDCTTVFYWMVY